MKIIFTKLSVLFCSLLFCLNGNAQIPNWQWASGIGSLGDDVGMTVAADSLGNVYTTGFFTGTVDFDPGPAIFNLTAAGNSDIFILKLDNAGDFMWAKAIGGTATDEGKSIAFDNTGNMYITGSFNLTADFDPGVATLNLTAVGNNDIFLLKLNTAGNFIWAKAIGGLNSDIGYSIGVDDNENVYTTGCFGGTVDFDPGSGISNISSVGFDDAFILKLDSAGNFIWAKSLGGTSYDYSRSLAIDNADNVYLIGDFEGVVDFDPGADTFNLTSAMGGTNVFISKLDSGGNFIWARGMIGLAAATGSAIALDASGNVYSTGYFIGTIDLDPDTSTLDFTSFDSEEDVFISKLDSSGTFQWAKSFGGVSTEVSYSIVLDDSANVLIAGGFRFSVDFDPGVGTYNLTPIGTFNGYVSKLDSAGNFIYALAAGGLNSDFIRSISIANTGETFIAGYFGSSVISFGSITLTNASTNSDRDFFIAKFDNLTTGFQQLDNNKGISLFPNPSNNYFNLIINNITELSIVSITDINGKIVYSVESQSSTIRINTSDFATGIYICKVKSGTEISTNKLIKY